ncbi:hypothetical protein [Brachyspira alvinipulli]|nr:hypothetical protein [Brachyspira alvinipulli]
MFKLILIFLIGAMVFFTFIGIVKYYNKFMNEVEGTLATARLRREID